MKTVWMNHWFSTAVNIIELLRANGQDVRIICTNEHEYSVIKNVSDEWYQEPVLKDDEYRKSLYSLWRMQSMTGLLSPWFLRLIPPWKV